MTLFLEALRILAEPLRLMFEMLSREEHTPEDEQQVIFAMQRAISDERMRRKIAAEAPRQQ